MDHYTFEVRLLESNLNLMGHAIPPQYTTGGQDEITILLMKPTHFKQLWGPNTAAGRVKRVSASGGGDKSTVRYPHTYGGKTSPYARGDCNEQNSTRRMYIDVNMAGGHPKMAVGFQRLDI